MHARVTIPKFKKTRNKSDYDLKNAESISWSGHIYYTQLTCTFIIAVVTEDVGLSFYFEWG